MIARFISWFSNRRCQLATAAFLIILSAFITRWYSLSGYELDWDEANRMSIAHSLNHGRTLYVDACDHHTFLDILFFQQVFRIFSPELAPKVIHLINILVVAAISFLVFYIVSLVTSSFAAALFGSFVAAFLFPHVVFRSSNGELYHSLTSIVAIVLYFFGARSRFRLAIVGALLMAGFCVKQTAIFDIGAFLVVHWLAVRQRGKSDGLYRSEIAWLGAGAGSVILLSVGYFVWHGALREAIYGTFLDAFIYSTGVALDDSLRRYWSTLGSELAFLSELHWMISLSILASYLCLLYPRQEPKVRFLGVAAFTWLVFVLAGIVSIGRFYHHYFIQLVAPLALVCAYWVAILPTRIRLIPVLTSLVLLYADPIVYPRVTNFFAKEEFNPNNIDMVAAFIRENTRRGESIFLYQNGALCLYFLTERFPPTKVFMDAQMLAENKDGPTLLEDGLKRWKKNPPKFIVTGNSSWYSIPEIDELLSRDYSKHTNFSVFQIHKRNGSDDLETQRPSDSGQAVKTLPSGSLTQSLGGAL